MRLGGSRDETWHGGGAAVRDDGLEPASARLIALSRVALAAGGLLAIYFDPDQPSRGWTGYVFVGAYIVFALLMLAALRRPLTGLWAIASHGVEVALVILIIAYTEGPSSPFFVYFTFVLLTATLCWQWRGALI